MHCPDQVVEVADCAILDVRFIILFVQVYVFAPRKLHKPCMCSSYEVSIQRTVKFVAWDRVVLKPHENRQLRTSLVILAPYLLGNVYVRLASERLKFVHVHLYSVIDIIWTLQLIELSVRTQSPVVNQPGVRLRTFPIWLG